MNHGHETQVAGPAGRLVGRAMHRWRRRAVPTLGALLVVYSVFAVWFHTGRPSIVRNFTAEFNAGFAAVPVSERAWTVYREAVLKLPVAEHHPGMVGWPEPAVEGPDAGPVLEYLALAAEALELTRRAAAMPVLGYEVGDALDRELYERRHGPVGDPPDARFIASVNPFLLNIVSDQHAVLRELTRLLRTDVRLAALQSDSDRVFTNLTAILAMADHAEQDFTLVSQLVAFAIRMVAFQGIAEAMGSDPDLMTDGQLEQLFRLLARLDGGGRPDLKLDGERALVLDLAQRMFTDDGAGDGRICLAGIRHIMELRGESIGIEHYLLGPINAMIYGSRREFVAEYDRLLGLFRNDIELPVWEQSEEWASARAIEAIENDPRATITQRLVTLLIPALRKAAISAESVRMERDAVLLGLAAELHRRRTGEYPVSAAVVEDRFPGGLPPDWIDGQPLRYAIRDGRAVVYSLGPDGDDDGGRLPEEGASGRLLRRGGSDAVAAALATPRGRRQYDGDLVMWPRWPAPASDPASPDAGG